MHIQYLTRQGDLLSPNRVRPSAHQENLSFLNNNQDINNNIRREVNREINIFLETITLTGEGYLNSGWVATQVCDELVLPQDTFHHGLVGSSLNLELGNTDSDLILTASKGEGQTWFDYFVSGGNEV